MAQVFLVQVVSKLASHVTTVAGLTAHLYGSVALSQYKVPLHKLPSSLLAQSVLTWQAQVLVPAAHEPLLQASLLVHGLPSLHALVLLA